MLWLANIAGVYGLSYVASLFGVLAFLFLVKKLYKKMPYNVAIAVLCTAIIIAPGLSTSDQKIDKEVISLEAYFDREFLAQENARALKNAEVKEAIALALKQDPDVIVTPEDVRWSDSFETTADLFAWVKEQTSSRDVVIIDTGPAVDARGENVIRAYMYDLSTESIYFFDKKFLVPQGEFLSYIHELGLSLLTSKEQMETIHETVRFKAGVIDDSELVPQHLPGILFCFETMVPYGVKKAASYRDPDLIVHPISHAWFTDPSSLEYQLNSMLKVHAVWNNIPIVTSGSMTDSKMYLPSGEVGEGEVIKTAPHWTLKRFSL
jgi:apolipoprotein N-acyltransferase